MSKLVTPLTYYGTYRVLIGLLQVAACLALDSNTSFHCRNYTPFATIGGLLSLRVPDTSEASLRLRDAGCRDSMLHFPESGQRHPGTSLCLWDLPSVPLLSKCIRTVSNGSVLCHREELAYSGPKTFL